MSAPLSTFDRLHAFETDGKMGYSNLERGLMTRTHTQGELDRGSRSRPGVRRARWI